MPKENKSTKTILDHRVNEVAGLLCRFMSRREILEYVRKNTNWEVSTAQIDNYIAKAKEELKQQTSPHEMRGMLEENFKMLFAKNMEIEDFRECRAVLESIAKLTGANAPQEQKIELSSGIDFSKISTQALKEIANARATDKSRD